MLRALPGSLGPKAPQDHRRLVNLRVHIDAGGDMIGAVGGDQSACAHLEQFDALAGRNAQQVFTEMEWQ